MTLSAEKTLGDIVALLTGASASGVSSSERALATIRDAVANTRGATSVPLVTLTGLTNRLDPGFNLSGKHAVLLAPIAIAWEPGTTYSLQVPSGGFNGAPKSVRPTTPTGATFVALGRVVGITGAIEPTWPTDGSVPTLPDGDLLYVFAIPVITWSAELHITDQGLYIVDGHKIWREGSVATQLTGTTKPDFSDTSAQIHDGDVTWTYWGETSGPWTALSLFASPNPASGNTAVWVEPATPNGYIFNAGFAGVDAVSGDTEPDWGAISPGDGTYVVDSSGNFIWQESTGAEALIVTGIRRPSGPSLLTLAYAIPSDIQANQQVILVDDVSGAGFSPSADPAIGDALSGTSNLALPTSTPTARLFHTGTPTGRWTYLGS